MNFLHPGIVTGFVQEEPDYVIVSTDDGDTRDVHIQQIRFAIMLSWIYSLKWELVLKCFENLLPRVSNYLGVLVY